MLRLFDRMLSLVRFPLLIVILILLAPQISIAEAPIQNTLTGIHAGGGPANQAKIQADIAKIPIGFIANAGQEDEEGRFMVKGGEQTILFTPPKRSCSLPVKRLRTSLLAAQNYRELARDTDNG